MAPSDRQPLALRKDISSNQLRYRFAGLAINPRTKVHSDRVSKSTSSKPTSLSRARARPRPRITRSLDLTPTEVECARAIFDRLQMTSRRSSRTPQLCQCSNGNYEFEYPAYRRWNLKELRRTLTADDIYSVWTTLLSDICQLHDAHVAYIPDMKTLTLKKASDGTSYRPIIDTFDFSKHVDDPEVPWADLKKHSIGIMGAQLQILAHLAELRDSSSFFIMDFDSQPDIVVDVLEFFIPCSFQRNAVLREVKKYSHKLGKYIAAEIGGQLYTYPRRKGPDDEYTEKLVSDDYSTLLHAFTILDEHMKNRQVELGDLRTRFDFWLLRVALLIRLHAKEVQIAYSRGIVKKYSEALADSYTSLEGFQSVANAYRGLKEAIRHFQNEGGEVEDSGVWSLTVGSWATAASLTDIQI
ncbi:hypothetical protein GGR51DRAFT_514350 [Nemania sp. FL0031]|nr:hypothetical protein GGR51DRAFT_514350 [Nemania sp. FL0031]